MSEDGWAPITEFAAGWHADPDDPPMVRKSGETVEMKGKIIPDPLYVGEPPTWDELRESGAEVGIVGDSGINDFALFRQQFKERIYTALDLTAEERELADAVGAVWETENEISRLRREAFIEHAHALAEQISTELTEKLQLPDGYTVAFDETPL